MINPLTQPTILFTCPKKQLIDFSQPCKHCISMVMASIPYLQRVVGAKGRRGTRLLILLALLWLCQPSSWRKQIRVNTKIPAYRANALKTQMAVGPQTKICSFPLLLPPSQQIWPLLFRCTIYCYYHHLQQFPRLVPHVLWCGCCNQVVFFFSLLQEMPEHLALQRALEYWCWNTFSMLPLEYVCM